ncbi:hypothetical protein VIN01S_00460 [Vibrio inusitatus NBRC 102082]|uniref:Imelysin-like domain-containing protein n=1 Tax=Vibrio inusitatus NBRC 102082 TaxID=1219070 RepID=A0A4Y3HR75_9VIBR|nr:hypothetical protein [Vibrio inusitatus]GEA49242.1 hypothetical protein VIN01S_00460 [Vibrio inusitatus NBRC 102082]
MQKRWIISLLALSCGSTIAGEVDNYYGWGKNLPDESVAFNQYLNEAVAQTLLKQKTKQAKAQCVDVAQWVMQNLGAQRYPLVYRGALNSDMEIWAQDNLVIDKLPTADESLDEYAEQSIYAPAMRTAGVKTDLDHIINVNGVYIGTDKISHFLGSGYEYYKRYRKALQSRSSELAQMQAIAWADSMEGGLLGMKVVGVYSYADLEANYQGFLFAKNLCDTPYITQIDKKWNLTTPIDLKNYVNPNWDESFNASAYSRSRKESVKNNLMQLPFCELKESSWVKSQTAQYRQFNLYPRVKSDEYLNTSFSAQLLFLTQQYKHKPETLTAEYLHQQFKQLNITQSQLDAWAREVKTPLQFDYTLNQLCP